MTDNTLPTKVEQDYKQAIQKLVDAGCQCQREKRDIEDENKRLLQERAELRRELNAARDANADLLAEIAELRNNQKRLQRAHIETALALAIAHKWAKRWKDAAKRGRLGRLLALDIIMGSAA